MCLDALHHHKVVFLPWSIHAGGSQGDAGQLRHVVEQSLGSQLALAVCGVGHGRIPVGYLLIGLLFPHGPEYTETAHEHKAAQGHLQFHQGLGQMARALGVGVEKLLCVQALGHSCGVHHIVQTQGFQLALQLFLVVQMQLYQVYALILQPCPAACLAHGGPHVHAALQGLFHYKTAYETGGAGHEYVLVLVFHVVDDGY